MAVGRGLAPAEKYTFEITKPRFMPIVRTNSEKNSPAKTPIPKTHLDKTKSLLYNTHILDMGVLRARG